MFTTQSSKNNQCIGGIYFRKQVIIGQQTLTCLIFIVLRCRRASQSYPQCHPLKLGRMGMKKRKKLTHWELSLHVQGCHRCKYEISLHLCTVILFYEADARRSLGHLVLAREPQTRVSPPSPLRDTLNRQRKFPSPSLDWTFVSTTLLQRARRERSWSATTELAGLDLLLPVLPRKSPR